MNSEFPFQETSTFKRRILLGLLSLRCKPEGNAMSKAKPESAAPSAWTGNPSGYLSTGSQSADLTSSLGFSLLEVTIAIGIAGVLLSGIWQLTAVAGQQREAAGLASQTMIVTAGAKDFISSGAVNAALLALPTFANLGDVIQIRVTNADPGSGAVPSLQAGGQLPAGFTNINSYGQTYTLFVRREDGGTLGVADAGDRIIGLLLTTGGASISDTMGTKIVGALGAPGGFIYKDTPTLASGAAGAWSADFSSTWSAAASYASAGHVASLVNLIPTGLGIGGGTSGVRSIDDLTDARTNYGADLNLFMGAGAGDSINSGGQNNTGVGIYALRNLTTGDNNIALGLNSGLALTTGNNNISIGAAANFSDGTLSNQLNIGNAIYGNLSTKQINIGSPTIVAGIGLDVGTNTSASRLSVGTTAQRPACTAALNGAERVNSQTQTVELCVGGAWMQPSPAWTPVDSTPPTPPNGTGFIVLTAGSWDGNLGGLIGARQKCLDDLSNNDWRGKATALARNQIKPEKISVLLFSTSFNGMSTPMDTTYYVAVSGNPAAGGANVTTHNNGWGSSCMPFVNCSWPQFTGSNYFDGLYEVWIGDGNDWAGNVTCDKTFVSNNSSKNGIARKNTYQSISVSCDESKRLLCVINP